MRRRNDITYQLPGTAKEMWNRRVPSYPAADPAQLPNSNEAVQSFFQNRQRRGSRTCPGSLNTEPGPPQIWPGLLNTEFGPPQIWPGLLNTEFGPPNSCCGFLTTEFGPPVTHCLQALYDLVVFARAMRQIVKRICHTFWERVFWSETVLTELTTEALCQLASG